MRKALIFAHFDAHGIVDPYVMHLLSCYRQYFEIIVFVSTADLGTDQQRRVLDIVDRLIVRSNVGYDFLSWRIGFEAFPSWQHFDEVVFSNDSCYGPCSDLAILWQKIHSMDADLWGASINCQFRPHVQSFFMGFGPKLIRSRFINRFWASVENTQDKSELILKYEVGLSKLVEDAGFKIGAIVDPRAFGDDALKRVIADNISETDCISSAQAIRNILAQRTPNPMQLFWGESLRTGSPFVKVELFRDNPLKANLASLHKFLVTSRWYDPSLIAGHLRRTVRCTQFPPREDRTNFGLRADFQRS